jgi:hypothetical protein
MLPASHTSYIQQQVLGCCLPAATLLLFVSLFQYRLGLHLACGLQSLQVEAACCVCVLTGLPVLKSVLLMVLWIRSTARNPQ